MNKGVFLREGKGATLYCDMCGSPVKSDEKHTCPTIWGLFNEENDPEIQRIDDLDLSPDLTDDDAKVQFVQDLEAGNPAALKAAETILNFYSGVPR